MSLLLAWLLAVAQAPIEGVYVAQQRETATALELEQDGRYRWFYSQGALDLSSEGRWAKEGDAILLTSDPVTPPNFSYSGASAGGKEGLLVKVLTAAGDPIPAVDILIQYQGGKSDIGHSDADGQQRFELRPGAAVDHIALALPAFEVRSEEFKLRPKQGETLTFRLEPNDIGKQAFAGQRLSLDNGTLSLSFRGAALRYERQEGGLEEVP